MSLLCGFNGFEQLNSLTERNDLRYISTPFVKIWNSKYEVQDFSWNGVLFLLDGVAKYAGFHNGLKGQVTDLIPPSQEKTVQGSCNDDSCFLIGTSGKLWEYDIRNSKWTILHLAERQEHGSSAAVSKVCSSNNVVLALTNSGEAFSVPSLVSPEGLSVVQVACGYEHGILLTESGLVYAWGIGSRGQLGLSDVENRDEPEEVPALSGMKVVSIAAGGWHSCAVTSSGDLYAWGWNNQGQLGKPTTSEDATNGVNVLAEPTLIEWPDLEVSVRSVTCGASHTLTLLRDGTVWGCGWNKWHQLGVDEPESFSKMTLLHTPSAGLTVNKIIASEWNSALIY